MAFLNNLIIIIIALIIITAIYKIIKKSPERYYQIASKLHKKGQKYHNLGEDNLSNEYYEEAEYYRKKAEELKNVE
tara:strand:- start:11995 stop:12222 length:228 start_codon:yes stop_codon:yes gene_type:complete